MLKRRSPCSQGSLVAWDGLVVLVGMVQLLPVTPLSPSPVSLGTAIGPVASPG